MTVKFTIYVLSCEIIVFVFSVRQLNCSFYSSVDVCLFNDLMYFKEKNKWRCTAE